MILWQAIWLRTIPAYVLWFAILTWMRDRHPRLIDEGQPLGPGRKLVALLLLAIFVLCFLVIPVSFA